MALHRSEQIMAAVLTQLTGLTTTGSDAKRNYTHPFDSSITDGLYVIMGAESPVDDSNKNYSYIDIDLEIIVSVHTLNAAPETRLNLIKKEITIAMMTDPLPFGLAWIIDVDDAIWTQPEISDGKKPTAMTEGRFNIKYRRSITDPSA